MGKIKGRRGHNEGSIYQRESDGRWCATITLGYEAGKRKRKTIYGATRKEVAEKLKPLLRDQQQGLPVATERQTVAHFLETWLEQSVIPRVRPTTIANYQRAVKNHLIPGLGRIVLSKLSVQDVQLFFTAKQREGLAISSIHQLRQTLTTALNQAVKWQLVPRNVASLTELPALRYGPARALTIAEIQAFLEIIQGDPWELAFLIALTLGLRRGEVLGLQWSDIDTERQTVHVQRTLQVVAGRPKTFGPPKTAASNRTLPIPPTLFAALMAYQANWELRRAAAGDTWIAEWDLLFCTGHGTPIDGQRMLLRLHRLLTEAGLPSMRFHDLRHSCASLLALQGVSARVAMEILGHSDVRITQNLYTHIYSAQKEAALTGLDTLLTAQKARLATSVATNEDEQG